MSEHHMQRGIKMRKVEYSNPRFNNTPTICDFNEHIIVGSNDCKKCNEFSTIYKDEHFVICKQEIGKEEDSVCNRMGCGGIIELHPSDNCSCHINPPCTSCTDPRLFCTTCGWEEMDE